MCAHSIPILLVKKWEPKFTVWTVAKHVAQKIFFGYETLNCGEPVLAVLGHKNLPMLGWVLKDWVQRNFLESLFLFVNLIHNTVFTGVSSAALWTPETNELYKPECQARVKVWFLIHYPRKFGKLSF